MNYHTEAITAFCLPQLAPDKGLSSVLLGARETANFFFILGLRVLSASFLHLIAFRSALPVMVFSRFLHYLIR